MVRKELAGLETKMGLLTVEFNKFKVEISGRMRVLESRQENFEKRLREYDRRSSSPSVGGVRRSSDTPFGRSSASEWLPSFLEVKGFCGWDVRREEGATRASAQTLDDLLRARLPPEILEHLKPFRLRGVRNYAVIYPVTPEYAHELCGTIREALNDPDLFYHGRTLYAVLERTPEDQAKCRTLGKCAQYLKNLAAFDPEQIPTAWKLDFVIYVEDEGPQLLAALKPTGGIEWSRHCQESTCMDEG